MGKLGANFQVRDTSWLLFATIAIVGGGAGILSLEKACQPCQLRNMAKQICDCNGLVIVGAFLPGEFP